MRSWSWCQRSFGQCGDPEPLLRHPRHQLGLIKLQTEPALDHTFGACRFRTQNRSFNNVSWPFRTAAFYARNQEPTCFWIFILIANAGTCVDHIIMQCEIAAQLMPAPVAVLYPA